MIFQKKQQIFWGICFVVWCGVVAQACRQALDQKQDTKQPISAKGKVVMAVFAHPDDELYAGPILSRYAREGAKVQLVVVTDGRYGTGQTDLKPGDELTQLRNEEVNCAAAHMGIETPIWMGYHDQLKLKGGFFGHVPYIQEVMRKLDSLTLALQPDAIITWGPDGGSNHMDHRIVGASVTQVYLSRQWAKDVNLFYVATPVSHIEDEDAKRLRGVEDSYLTTQVSYTQQDLENAKKALQCYKSQFSPESMSARIAHWDQKTPKVYLRPLAKADQNTDNIFEPID